MLDIIKRFFFFFQASGCTWFITQGAHAPPSIGRHGRSLFLPVGAKVWRVSAAARQLGRSLNRPIRKNQNLRREVRTSSGVERSVPEWPSDMGVPEASRPPSSVDVIMGDDSGSTLLLLLLLLFIERRRPAIEAASIEPKRAAAP